MIAYTDAAGLFGCAIACAVLAVRLPGVSRLHGARRVLVALGVAALALIPFGVLSAAAYLRGAVGDLSIPSLMLMTGYIVAPGRGEASGKLHLLGLMALAAVIFYPLALGWGSFDPYHLGFGSNALLAVLFALAIFAWFKRLNWVAVALSLAVLAWALHGYASTNLWDYLLDPLVAVYALGVVVRRVLKLAGRKSSPAVRSE